MPAEPDAPTVRDVLAAAVAAVEGQERPGQIAMAEAVAGSMESGQHLLVQAGTGTGKSLGYLVPALLHHDRVVVATPNGYEMLLLCLAASRAGGIPVPVNPQLTKVEFDHVVANSQASLVLRSAAHVDDGEPMATAVPADVGDVAALFYTSGTTGQPKGVEVSHRALLSSFGRAAAVHPALSGRLEAVVSLPVAHVAPDGS